MEILRAVYLVAALISLVLLVMWLTPNDHQ